MAKIRNEELSQLTAEVLPERAVLGPLPAGGGSALPLLGQVSGAGGLPQSVPMLGQAAAPAGGAGATPDGVVSAALQGAFGGAPAGG